MTAFRTLDQADVKGKRVLVRVDLNVPMENGRVTDATRIERVLPTIREIADKGGQGRPSRPFRPPEGPRSEGVPEAGRGGALEPSRQARSPSPTTASATPPRRPSTALKDGDVLLLENTRFHAGEEKNDPAFVEELAEARRPLRQRRLLGRPPRPCLDRGPRPRAAGLCGPHHAGGAGGADEGSRGAQAPGRRHRRRRQGLDQDRPARKPGQQGRRPGDRRRHGQHLPARHGPRHRQVARREGPRRRRRCASSSGRGRPNCAIILPVDGVCAYEFKAGAHNHTYGIDAIPEDQMILDVGSQSVERVNAAINDAATLVWNGPLGAFEIAALRPGHGRGGPPRGGAHPGRQARVGGRRRRHGRGAQPCRRGGRASPTSRRQAAPSSNGSRASRCRASRR